MFKTNTLSVSFFACSALWGCQQIPTELLQDLSQTQKELTLKISVQQTESSAPTSVPTITPSITPSPSPTNLTPDPIPISPSPTIRPTQLPPPLPETSPDIKPSPTPQVTAIPTPQITPTPVPTPTPQVTPTPVSTPTPTPTPTPVQSISPGDTGLNASLSIQVFPSDNAWNQTIDTLPVDPNSDQLIESIGLNKNLHPDFGANWNGGPFGIPYYVVDEQTPQVAINYTAYGSESDPGPFPIPPNAPIEGGPDATGDRHILVVDKSNALLYELFYAFPNTDGSYNAASGAVFNLNSNELRPAGWTSADAAGLPIFAGLVRYDEVVEKKEINHALRFTAARTRRAYTHPARHFASKNSDPALPPMGMRVRLKSDYDISGYAPEAQVILRALKKYGMILADNGSDWFVTGVADQRWNDSINNTLKQVKGRDFEVVKMGDIITD